MDRTPPEIPTRVYVLNNESVHVSFRRIPTAVHLKPQKERNKEVWLGFCMSRLSSHHPTLRAWDSDVRRMDAPPVHPVPGRRGGLQPLKESSRIAGRPCG